MFGLNFVLFCNLVLIPLFLFYMLFVSSHQCSLLQNLFFPKLRILLFAFFFITLAKTKYFQSLLTKLKRYWNFVLVLSANFVQFCFLVLKSICFGHRKFESSFVNTMHDYYDQANRGYYINHSIHSHDDRFFENSPLQF